VIEIDIMHMTMTHKLQENTMREIAQYIWPLGLIAMFAAIHVILVLSMGEVGKIDTQ
jgi:hypothetical protein